MKDCESLYWRMVTEQWLWRQWRREIGTTVKKRKMMLASDFLRLTNVDQVIDEAHCTAYDCEFVVLTTIQRRQAI